jgi:hypothetical protein
MKDLRKLPPIGLGLLILLSVTGMASCSQTAEVKTAPPPKVEPLTDEQRAANKNGFLKRFHAAPSEAGATGTAQPTTPSSGG